ncbi:PKD domain-containing protein [Thermococcus indicus]|uniref:PKD domain-containing protein n=1 Tax=Thermococcus indicus TaxID=2586643 RepID=A0A4Y5SPP4_9EURY|nr:PKD domain-containing protein [Thermococcus indicus]
MPLHPVRAEDADLLYGSGGMVIANEEIIIGDRGDYFWTYENETGGLLGKFHTGYEKWDELVSCDVNGDGRAEIIQGDRSTDKIYIYTMEGSELGKHDVNFEQGDDLACGDVNGDGKAEIIFADRNNWIKVFDEGFNVLNEFKVEDFEIGDSIGAGDFDGDGRAEIVHADYDEDMVTVYDTSGNVLGSFSTEDHFNLKARDEMATGDVNLDGLDEIVIASQDLSTRGIHIFSLTKENSQYKAVQIAKFTIPFQKGDRIALGDVNTDGVDEILWASQNGRVKAYNMGGDLLNGPDGLETEFTYGAGLAAGDVNGDSIVVGPPNRATMSVVNEVIAAINAPPVDFDVINETGIFYAEYKTKHGEKTVATIKATHDVKMSMGLKITTGSKSLGGGTELSIKTSLGVKMERERGESYETTVTYDLLSDMADGALYVSTDYELYEFPIISPPELAVINGEQQYILVSVPKGPPNVHFVNYDSSLHEIGDLNTYPTKITELKNYDAENVLGVFTIEAGKVGSAYEQYTKQLNWKKSRNTFTVGVSLNVKGGGGVKGIGTVEGTIEGNYGYERVSTHEVTFSDETSVLVSYSGRIEDRSKWYNATGVIYTDSEDGHLVLDFYVPSRGDYYLTREVSPIVFNFGFFKIDLTTLIKVFNKPPECSISASPSQGKNPLDVTFSLDLTDPNNDSLRWELDFGDGNIVEGNSTEVGYRYSEEGTYTALLRVYDPWGANSTCSANLKVLPNEKPTALFSYSPAKIRAGEEVSFTDSSMDPDGSVAKWSWNFGDGSTSNERNPRHAYTNPGSYTVMLTVEDESGLKGTYYKEITVEPQNYPPTADFAFLPKEPKAGEEISFADKSYDRDGEVVSWNWDFGDGSTSSEAEPVHVFERAGNYTVTLKVRDDGGGEDVRRITITVKPEESPSPTETTSTEAPATPSETTSSTPSGTTSSSSSSSSSAQPSPTESGGTCGPGIIVILAALLVLRRRR